MNLCKTLLLIIPLVASTCKAPQPNAKHSRDFVRKGFCNVENKALKVDGDMVEGFFIKKPVGFSSLFYSNLYRVLDLNLDVKKKDYFFKIDPPIEIGNETDCFAVRFHLSEILAIDKRKILNGDGMTMTTLSRAKDWHKVKLGTKILVESQFIKKDSVVLSLNNSQIRHDNLSPFFVFGPCKLPPSGPPSKPSVLSYYFNTFSGIETKGKLMVDSIQVAFNIPVTIQRVVIRKVHVSGSLK